MRRSDLDLVARVLEKQIVNLESLLRGSGYLGYVDSNQGFLTSISGLYVPKS